MYRFPEFPHRTEVRQRDIASQSRIEPLSSFVQLHRSDRTTRVISREEQHAWNSAETSVQAKFSQKASIGTDVTGDQIGFPQKVRTDQTKDIEAKVIERD